MFEGVTNKQKPRITDPCGYHNLIEALHERSFPGDSQRGFDSISSPPQTDLFLKKLLALRFFVSKTHIITKHRLSEPCGYHNLIEALHERSFPGDAKEDSQLMLRRFLSFQVNVFVACSGFECSIVQIEWQEPYLVSLIEALHESIFPRQ